MEIIVSKTIACSYRSGQTVDVFSPPRAACSNQASRTSVLLSVINLRKNRNYPFLYTTHQQPFFLKQSSYSVAADAICFDVGASNMNSPGPLPLPLPRRRIYEGRGISLQFVNDSRLIAWMVAHSLLYLYGRPLSVVLAWDTAKFNNLVNTNNILCKGRCH